jgi:zinc and cadmium transporter
MRNVWIYTLGSVMVVSLISLVGIFTLTLSLERLKKIILVLVSFSVGGLFGGAFIHLIPESFEKLEGHIATPLLILSGILMFFVLEKFISWRHCHIPTSDEHPHPVVFLNVVGDGLHNLLDGVIIGATYAVSIPIGLTTTLAVILHEIPQEIGDFGILIHGGLSWKKALAFNFLSATTAIAGAIISLLLGPQIKNYSASILPFTAGGFIYIAGSDLIPELQKEIKLTKSLVQLLSIISGIGIMALMVILE